MAERHVFVGVVSADEMQDDKKRNAQIRRVRKLQAPVRQGKCDHKNNEQDVFEEPGLSIERMNRGQNEDDAANGGQCSDEFTLLVQRFFRRRPK